MKEQHRGQNVHRLCEKAIEGQRDVYYYKMRRGLWGQVIAWSEKAASKKGQIGIVYRGFPFCFHRYNIVTPAPAMVFATCGVIVSDSVGN